MPCHARCNHFASRKRCSASQAAAHRLRKLAHGCLGIRRDYTQYHPLPGWCGACYDPGTNEGLTMPSASAESSRADGSPPSTPPQRSRWKLLVCSLAWVVVACSPGSQRLDDGAGADGSAAAREDAAVMGTTRRGDGGGASNADGAIVGDGATANPDGATTGPSAEAGTPDGGTGASDSGGPGDGAAGVDPRSPGQLALSIGSCSSAGTDAAIEALARAGIETRDDVTKALERPVTPPVRGLHVWTSQARGMACDIANGAGLSGHELNSMLGPLPLPNGSTLPFSALLAAYATTEGAFGSDLTRALMGSIDTVRHAEVVYPTLVIILFMREVILPFLAVADDATALSVTLSRPTFAAPGLADPCGAISEFLNDFPAAVAGAVGSLAPAEESGWSTVFSVASSIVHVAAYATAEAARTLIRHLPFVDAVRTAAQAVSIVADMRAMFTQWELEITSDPTRVHKSVGSTNEGTFTLTAKPPEQSGLDWPAPLRSCAELLDITLPNFDTADGASVTWSPVTGFNDPAYEVRGDAEMASGEAEYIFATVNEPEALHNEGQCELSTEIAVLAELGLPGLENLASTLANRVGSSVAEAAVGAGAPAAATLLGPSKIGNSVVTYHPTSARVDFDNGFERIHIASNEGVGPNATWSGTFRMMVGDTGGVACGPAQEQPVSVPLSNGVGNLALSFSFPGGVFERCAFSFSETITLEPDPDHGGCMLTTSGSYTQTLKPPDPGAEVVTPGERAESYRVEVVPEY